MFAHGTRRVQDRVSDSEVFSEIFRLYCMVLFSYTVQKRESIPGTKHWIHKRKKLQDVVPGRTYALNDKNSALCNEMFPKEF